MNKRNNNDQWRKRIAEEGLLEQYLADMLSDDARAGLEEHLVECAESRAELEELRSMDDMLRTHLTVGSMDPGLSARISYRVSRETMDDERDSVFVVLRRYMQPLQYVAAAMLLGLCGYIADGNSISMARVMPGAQMESKALSANQDVRHTESRSLAPAFDSTGLVSREEEFGDYAIGIHGDPGMAPPSEDDQSMTLDAYRAVDEERSKFDQNRNTIMLAGDADLNNKAALRRDYLENAASKTMESGKSKEKENYLQNNPAAQSYMPTGSHASDKLAARLPDTKALQSKNYNEMAALENEVRRIDEQSSNRKTVKGEENKQPLSPVPDEGDSRQPEQVSREAKLIRTAQSSFEVENYATTLDRLRAIVQEEKGFVASENSARGENGKVRGTVVLKVPPESFDRLLLKLRGIGELKSQSIKTQDVTEEYFDTAARIHNLQVLEARLLDIMKKEAKVEELLKVEQELAKTREQIERLQGQMKALEFKIALSTVVLDLLETGISDTAVYLKTRNANMVNAAKDVAKAFETAKQMATDLEARVVLANLQEDPERKSSRADLRFEVAPDKFAALLDKLKTAGDLVVDLKVTSEDTPKGGVPGRETATPKVEEKVGYIQLAILQLNPFYKETAGIAGQAPNVREAFAKLQQLAKDQGGKVRSAQLFDNKDENQVRASLELEIPSEKFQAVLVNIREQIKVIDLQQGDAMFEGSRNFGNVPGNTFAVVSLSLGKLVDLPVQSTRVTAQVADVSIASGVMQELIRQHEARITDADVQTDKGELRQARMSLEVRYSNYDALYAGIKALGYVSDVSVERMNQKALLDDETAVGPKAVRIATIALNIQRAEPILVKRATLSYRAGDVQKAFENARDFAMKSGCKVVASGSTTRENSEARLVIRFDEGKFNSFAEYFSSLGAELRKVVESAERPDYENPDAKKEALIELTLTDAPPALSDRGGSYSFLGQSFGRALELFFNSIAYIVKGILLVLPWMLVVGVAWFVYRRMHKA